MHSISFVEAHEVMHRGGNEFATARHCHIDVSIGHDGSTVRVYDFPVDARMMIDLFIEDLERAGLGEMAVASARDR